MSKLATLTTVFSLFVLLCQAQLAQINALNQQLSRASSPSDSIRIYLQLSEFYEDVNVELGASIIAQTHTMLQRHPDDSLELISILRQAHFHTLSSEFDQSEHLLQGLLRQQLSQSIRSEVLLQLGKNLQLSGHHDSAIFYLDKAIMLSLELEDHLGVQLSKAYKSESLNRVGQLQEALDFCSQSLMEIQRIQAKKEEAIILNFLGGINTSLGAMPVATKHYLAALTIADSLQNERLKMEQLNDIGVIYAVQGETDESIDYFQRALTAALNIRSHRDYIGTLSNLAYMYSVTDQMDLSILSYQEALAYNDQYGDACLHPFIYDGLARLYERLDQPDSVKKYFGIVLKEARNCQLKEFEISALQGMGRYYREQGLIQQSITQFRNSFAIAEANNFKPLLQISADQLYQSYKEAGDFSMALKFHEISEAMQDSIYNEQNKDEILRLTAKYEFETEKHKIEDEQERQEIQYLAELRGQLLTRNFMMVGLVLTLILIFTLWRSYVAKQRSNIVLARLNREKNELIGVVAHDLRNPLNAILGFSQILMEELDESAKSQHQYLSRINGSASRMKHMIERVLDVNAIESEMMNLEVRSVDMAALLDNVIDTLNPSAEIKKIVLARNYDNHKFFAEIDESYGFQIFENLISNAIKFSEHNKAVDITVMFAGDRIKVLVEDHGPGIDKEDLQLLFQRYTKLTPQPTGNESSTGLGLSIVKKYVVAMGGEIDVKSVMGVGTTFIVSFWSSATLQGSSASNPSTDNF
ncbi:MAG: ATP-binding protein [Cytophagales bacterium]|nr:ATP-binding protein [Cytophagales bacterium]